MTAMAATSASPVPSDAWRATLRQAVILIAATFGILGVWSAVARIDSGVVASGTIESDSNRKTVQHLEGGIVSEILVRDGSDVRQGDVILRLDPTRSAASDELLSKQLSIARVLEAHLLAQRNLASVITIPTDVLAQSADATIRASINDNRQQFTTRRQVLQNGLDVLERQIAQAETDIAQTATDRSSAESQLASVDPELEQLRGLLKRGLVPLPRVNTLERQQVQLRAVVDKSRNDESRSREKIGEIKLKVGQLKDEYVQEAAARLVDVRKTLSDLSQQTLIARDALRRVEIKAPVAGTVQQLRIFTVGGVLKAGEPILDIVPVSDQLVVRAKVSPIDRDRLQDGQPAEIRLPQFVAYENLKIMGTVRSVSRDSISDSASRETYFAADVIVDRSTVPAEIGARLTAGMTTQVVFPTGERTVLQYLASPLLNRLALGLKER